MKSNPFATRFVLPGRLPWDAVDGQSVATLCQRLQACGWRAAIVGPHGTGKSTLLEHLAPALGQLHWRGDATTLAASFPEARLTHTDAFGDRPAARQLIWLGLRRGQRPLSCVLATRRVWQPQTLLILDGWEQLRSWQRPLVRWATAYRGSGLLVTSHRPVVGLPTLYRTAGQPELLQRLVSQLLASQADVPHDFWEQYVTPAALQLLLVEEQGSVREVFMRLYDAYEIHTARSARCLATHETVGRGW